MMTSQKQLKEKTDEALSLLESYILSKPINIYTGRSIDGLAASLMIANLLLKSGKSFRLRSFNEEADLLTQLKTEGLSILVDIVGAEALIKKLEVKGSLIVLSHYIPTGMQSSKMVIINPELYGFDGSIEACSSSITFLLISEAKVEDVFSKHLLCLGIMGEGQVLERDGYIRGVNALATTSIMEKGEVKVTRKLRLFAPSYLPLYKSLASTLNPPIMSLLGNEKEALRLLEALNFSGEVSSLYLASLKTEERNRLIQALVKEAILSNVDASEADSFIGPILEADFNLSIGDLYEEACIMDACVKAGRLGLASSALIKGSKDPVLKEVVNEAIRYTWTLSLEVSKLKNEVLSSVGKVRVYKLQPSVWYSLADVAKALCCIHPTTITVAFSDRNESIKAIIAAGRKAAWDKELSIKMIQNTLSMGGLSWGHAREVGALLPSSKFQEFLKSLHDVVNEN